MKWVNANPGQVWDRIKAAGHRNGVRTLINLRLIRSENGRYVLNEIPNNQLKATSEIVWRAAIDESSIQEAIQYLKEYPTASGISVGHHISEKYNRSWSHSSMTKVGGRLKAWGKWIMQFTNKDGSFRKMRLDGTGPAEQQLSLIPSNDT